MGRFQCVYHLYLLKVIIYMNTTLVFNPKITRKGPIYSPPIAHKAQGFGSPFLGKYIEKH